MNVIGSKKDDKIVKKDKIVAKDDKTVNKDDTTVKKDNNAAKVKPIESVPGAEYNPSKAKYHPIDDAFWKHGDKYVVISEVLSSNLL